MRHLEITHLVVTSAVIGSDRSAWQALLRLERAGIGYLVVEAPGVTVRPPLQGIRSPTRIGASTLRSLPRVSTVSVGCSSWDCQLAELGAVHFHVGPNEDLSHKVAGLVPLCGQGLHAFHNVATWIERVIANSGVDLAQHEDIVKFAERSSREFRQPGKAHATASFARRTAGRLQAAFTEVDAVIGGGFPFSCMDESEAITQLVQTPRSILEYVDTQRDYFRSKVAPTAARSENPTTRVGLRQLGLEADRNVFDVYEFSREKCPPPPSGPARGTIDEFVKANELDWATSIWPCHLCTELHDAAKYPAQAFVKDFARSCLDCAQTTLIPRNVGGLTCDIDLVAVADVSPAERASFGARVSSWIDDDPEAYRYDTDFARTFVELEGPADVFVVSAEEFWRACERIGSGHDWQSVRLASSALWLPNTEHQLELGLNFALCVEPLVTRPSGWIEALHRVRRRFARAVTADHVIAALENGSFYHRQLLANERVRKLLRDRLGRWGTNDEAGA